ncbi:hypothetical protein [Flavobacterium branchiophilum]|uniref:Uncharacterized protein n=1 Tax=Flavobacterium branchiophilum TaxID=55197 RepID=A0A2H3KBX2_9FLAO|nr:hypothetical protein [Flavobacterium branchiophilum]PDS24662.1 hypothetical protein B0A77_07285 [Flavobacterium branchiophilum]
MAKQFIRVAKTNASKNKVQLLIIKHFLLIDKTLYCNLNEAVNMVKQIFESALKEYTGNAKIPELKRFDTDKNTLVYFVEDLIYIDIHTVLNDFTQ